MKWLCFVVVALATQCFKVEGRGVNVRLTASWPSSVLSPLAEVSEFLAEEDSHLFWGYMTLLNGRVSNSSDTQAWTAEEAERIALESAGPLLTDDMYKVLAASLYMRANSPTVEMYRELAPRDISSQCHGRSSAFAIILLHAQARQGYVACSVDDLSQKLALLSTEELDQSGVSGTVAVTEPLPIDHLYVKASVHVATDHKSEEESGRLKQRPMVILYGTLGSRQTAEFHEAIVDLADQYCLDYLYRHYLPGLAPEGAAFDSVSSFPTVLQGYGVSLDIKNMEYKTLDDAVLNHESSVVSDVEDEYNSWVDDEDLLLDGEEDVDGFFFDTLLSRFSHEAQKLKEFRDNLLQEELKARAAAAVGEGELSSVGSDTAESEALSTKDAKSVGGDADTEEEPVIKAWDMSDINLAATESILGALDPLLRLKSLSQFFPLHARHLSERKVSPLLREEVSKRRASGEWPTQPALLINGVRVSVEDNAAVPINVFRMMKVIREQLRWSDDLKSLSLPKSLQGRHSEGSDWKEKVLSLLEKRSTEEQGDAEADSRTKRVDVRSKRKRPSGQVPLCVHVVAAFEAETDSGTLTSNTVDDNDEKAESPQNSLETNAADVDPEPYKLTRKETKSVLYLNDIEKDPRYSRYPTDVKTFLRPQWGMKVLRKHLYNLVLVYNPLTAEGARAVLTAINFMQRGLPIRVGLVISATPPPSLCAPSSSVQDQRDTEYTKKQETRSTDSNAASAEQATAWDLSVLLSFLVTSVGSAKTPDLTSSTMGVSPAAAFVLGLAETVARQGTVAGEGESDGEPTLSIENVADVFAAVAARGASKQEADAAREEARRVTRFGRKGAHWLKEHGLETKIDGGGTTRKERDREERMKQAVLRSLRVCEWARMKGLPPSSFLLNGRFVDHLAVDVELPQLIAKEQRLIEQLILDGKIDNKSNVYYTILKESKREGLLFPQYHPLLKEESASSDFVPVYKLQRPWPSLESSRNAPVAYKESMTEQPLFFHTPGTATMPKATTMRLFADLGSEGGLSSALAALRFVCHHRVSAGAYSKENSGKEKAGRARAQVPSMTRVAVVHNPHPISDRKILQIDESQNEVEDEGPGRQVSDQRIGHFVSCLVRTAIDADGHQSAVLKFVIEQVHSQWANLQASTDTELQSVLSKVLDEAIRLTQDLARRKSLNFAPLRTWLEEAKRTFEYREMLGCSEGDVAAARRAWLPDPHILSFFGVKEGELALVMNGRRVPVSDAEAGNEGTHHAISTADLIFFQSFAASQDKSTQILQILTDEVGFDWDALTASAPADKSPAQLSSSVYERPREVADSLSNLVEEVASVLLGMSTSPRYDGQILLQSFTNGLTSFSTGPSADAQGQQSALEVVAVMDPLSVAAQRMSSILLFLREELGATVHVALSPAENSGDFPLKRFYQMLMMGPQMLRQRAERLVLREKALGQSPSLAREQDRAQPEQPNSMRGVSVAFRNLPLKPILTLSVDTPEPWNVQASESLHDLDNLRVADPTSRASSSEVVSVEFSLKNLLLSGHCMDRTSAVSTPPQGLQLELRPTSWCGTVAGKGWEDHPDRDAETVADGGMEEGDSRATETDTDTDKERVKKGDRGEDRDRGTDRDTNTHRDRKRTTATDTNRTRGINTNTNTDTDTGESAESVSSASLSVSSAVDTVVMKSLGYFQLPARPGLWRLGLKQGRTRELFDLVSAEDAAAGGSDAGRVSFAQLLRSAAQRHREGGGGGGDGDPAVVQSKAVVLRDFLGETLALQVRKKTGKEQESLLDAPEESSRAPGGGGGGGGGGEGGVEAGLASAELSLLGTGLRALSQWWGRAEAGEPEGASSIAESPKAEETVHVFSVATGALYERFLKVMMLSVSSHTSAPVKFWLLENFLSASFKESLPLLAAAFSFQYELVTYKWPSWLRGQTERQRVIWGYKILFLDVLFPLELHRVIYVDADQVLRADLKELWDLDMGGAPYGYVPFCSSREETRGFQFWREGYWKNHLNGKPYHISALYLVDLKRFRQMAAGDILRAFYMQLSADPNSLANLDQDLPNFAQITLPIFSLPQEWLWCESWCDDDSKASAKTIDLCNNPQHKEPKLEMARRIVSGPLFDKSWDELDSHVRHTEEEQRRKLRTRERENRDSCSNDKANNSNGDNNDNDDDDDNNNNNNNNNNDHQDNDDDAVDKQQVGTRDEL